jgi:uncharacterized membrane protein YgcG
VEFGTGGPVEPQNATLTILTTPVNGTLTIDGTSIGTAPKTRSLAPGTYQIGASAPGRLNATQIITLVEGESQTAALTLDPIPIPNATLTITTVPGAVTIGLNSTGGMTYAGITDSAGTLVLSVPPATYTLLATKPSHTPQTISGIMLTEGESESIGPITLIEETGARITSNSTNLTKVGSMYHLFETDTAAFKVTLNQSATITWTVDGQTVRTVQGVSDTFPWTPGILFTSNSDDTIVGVNVAGDVILWEVNVENVVNPFFSAESDEDLVTIHVFTNNNAVNLSHVNVSISTDAGTTIYPLEYTPSGFEVDWKKTIPAAYGNNRLLKITTFNNATGATTSYPLLGTERVHFRNFPGGGPGGGGSSDGRQSLGGGGGGGGGGGAAENPDSPTLVYVVLEKDVLGVADKQTITLDAKIGVGAIHKVEALFVAPDAKERTVQLELTSGTNQYGTWSASFGDLEEGKYTLSSVKMYTESGSMNARVRDRIFTVVDKVDLQSQEFALIYSLLDSSVVQNGTNVTLRIDARDTQGITLASAVVVSSKGDTFTVPLKLIRGNAQYGTWEGTFTVTESDATYTVKEITLARSAGQEKKFTITGRSVYVEPAISPGGLTGNVIAGPTGNELLKAWLRNPLLPTILGFLLMGVTMAVVLVSRRPKKIA